MPAFERPRPLLQGRVFLIVHALLVIMLARTQAHAHTCTHTYSQTYAHTTHIHTQHTHAHTQHTHRCLYEEVTGWPFLDAGNPSDRIGAEGAMPSSEPTKADYQALNKESEFVWLFADTIGR